jgi:peptide/nickel transport system substrate-binding protein
MKKTMRVPLVVLLLCLVTAGLVFLGCSPAEEKAATTTAAETTEPAEKESNLIMAIWSAPEGLFNPNLYESAYDAYSAVDAVFVGLMTHDPDKDYELVPNLAESMEISDDNMTFTYRLRDDIYFHDGEPVTTEDVKFTFEWMCHPDYTGVRSANWMFLEGFEEYNSGEADEVSGIEVVDEQTIKFHLSKVDAPSLIRISTWAISPKHVFEGTPIADLVAHPAMTAPIGAGPYKLTDYVEGQFTVLEAYDDFHRGRPNVDRITVKVASSDVQLAELLTGSSDLAWVQPSADEFDRYKKEGLSIVSYPANAYQYMGIQLKHPILSDKDVRHAITHALNRDQMVESLFDGMGIVQTSHMSSVSWAYDPDLEPKAFDPQKSRELLDQAGWKLGDDGYRYKNGEKLSFVLSYPSGNVQRERNAEIIQSMLKDVGVEIELEMMEFGSLIPKVYTERDFDLYLMGWSLALEADPSGIWLSTDQWNAVQFDHPDNDRLILAGRETMDFEERAEIYQEWQQLLVEEAPYVFLYSENEAFVHTPDLKNFHGDAFSMWWKVEEWELDR